MVRAAVPSFPLVVQDDEEQKLTDERRSPPLADGFGTTEDELDYGEQVIDTDGFEIIEAADA